MCSIGRLFILFLTAVLFLGASGRPWAGQPAKLEIQVFRLDPEQKKTYAGQPYPRLLWLLKNLKPMGAQVRISERTEFHAVIIDQGKAFKNRKVRIKWLHDVDERLYVKPKLRQLQVYPGYEHPMAVTGLWSAPSSSGKWYKAFLGSSTMRRNEWEQSRCYGRRILRVFDLQDNLLAEHSFEIYPEGMQVY